MPEDDDVQDNQFEVIATQEEKHTSSDPVMRPLTNHGKPWARLVGIGPTAEFGVFELHERQVIVGNAKKNVLAPIRIDDPRIRHAGSHRCLNPHPW